MSDITVLGLGNMGTALARVLLSSGRTVTVWNRSTSRANNLAEDGAIVAGTLAEAIAASDVILTCLKNHDTTTDLLKPVAEHVQGKTILEMSTGDAQQAANLVDVLENSGAGWLIGMINAYPSGIGQDTTAILCASPASVWSNVAETIKALGGASAHIGDSASAVPGLFAALFTARQGFMFGMLYGAAVCKNAGVPIRVLATQLPVTLDVAKAYVNTFSRTVPTGTFDEPEATMKVYLAALDDVMATFDGTGTVDGLPRMMRDLVRQGVDAGLSDQELTALVKILK